MRSAECGMPPPSKGPRGRVPEWEGVEKGMGDTLKAWTPRVELKLLIHNNVTDVTVLQRTTHWVVLSPPINLN